MNVLNQVRCSKKKYSWSSTCYFQMQMQQFLQQRVPVSVSTLLISTTASYSVTSSVSGHKDGGGQINLCQVSAHVCTSPPWCPSLFFFTWLAHSPLSQFCPPNPSGQSQLKEPHRFTQVPPFRHGLLLQKCLLAEHPRGSRERKKKFIVWSTLPHYFIKVAKSLRVIKYS